MLEQTTEQPGAVWSPAIPAQAIGRVVTKLADGTYQTEPVRCFCGADFNDAVLATHDRYFIPHRNVLCRECGLIRATPRMTPAAYYQFYRNEYRPIYDGWQFGAKGEDTDFRFMIQSGQGLTFKEFLEFFDLHPQTIIDVGANTGGMLAAFQETGATVYGIEWHESGRQYGERQGIPMLRSIEEAVGLGLKADLVILRDVVEHLTDLRELLTIQQLMAKDGVLAISTPGLFHANLDLIWQNAHTYTFVGETLRYVMSQLGFEELFLDENIDSLWVYHGEKGHVPKPAEWCRYIVECLERTEPMTVPPLRGVNKFPASERWTNMDRNLGRQLPDIRQHPPCEGEAIILAAGPSITGQVETIKDFQAKGGILFTIERMYPWCAKHGIRPDYVVCLDSAPDVVEGFTTLQDGVTYLMSSTVHPDAFDRIAGQPTYIFTALNPHLKIQNLWAKYGYASVRVVNTGGSVTLCAYALAMILGFRSLHFFGFDLKVADRDYADGVAGNGVERQYFSADVQGKTVLTCISFISFAQQFFRMTNDAHKAGFLSSIHVHGDSLINDMADINQVLGGQHGQ